MSRRWYVPTAVFAAVLMVAMSAVLGARSITAQDAATPETGGMTEPQAHPGHIHLGTCDTLGEVIFPLNDAVEEGVGGTPVASPMADSAMASPMASPTSGMGDVVASSTTENVGASLADIVAGGHAINFHESAEAIQNYIACGDITGDGTETELTVELQELNGSGYMGQATLTDNGDGTTNVLVELMRTDDMMASPVATPAA